MLKYLYLLLTRTYQLKFGVGKILRIFFIYLNVLNLSFFQQQPQQQHQQQPAPSCSLCAAAANQNQQMQPRLPRWHRGRRAPWRHNF